MPCSPCLRFPLAAEQGADLLLTVKSNQRRLYQQIVFQLRGNRHFSFLVCGADASYGCHLHLALLPAMPRMLSVSSEFDRAGTFSL